MKAGFIAPSARCIVSWKPIARVVNAAISSLIRPIRSRRISPPAANQLWSSDITRLRGPVKWTCYHLYVILDVFSRYVVGWMIAYRGGAELAKRLIDPRLPCAVDRAQ